MARKSLSAQVIEEVDRARGLLAPVVEIVDPMTGHMVGAVLESLRRIETLCLAAHQRQANEITDPSPLGIAFSGDRLSKARAKAAETPQRPGRGRRAKA